MVIGKIIIKISKYLLFETAHHRCLTTFSNYLNLNCNPDQLFPGTSLKNGKFIWKRCAHDFEYLAIPDYQSSFFWFFQGITNSYWNDGWVWLLGEIKIVVPICWTVNSLLSQEDLPRRHWYIYFTQFWRRLTVVRCMSGCFFLTSLRDLILWIIMLYCMNWITWMWTHIWWGGLLPSSQIGNSGWRWGRCCPQQYS